MKVEHAEEFTQALGQIASGAWRQIALAQEIGVPQALGLTTREWVEQRLGGYVRLSMPERREAVAELTANGKSSTETADVLGIHKATVNRDRANASLDEPEAVLEADIDEEADADAPLDDTARLAVLDADLVDRVETGQLTLRAAETIAAENRARVAAWAKEIRTGLATLRSMAGHPVPDDLAEHLSEEERRELATALAALATCKEE